MIFKNAFLVVKDYLLEVILENAVLAFSEEAHFHLPCCVNKQNERYWSGTNPRQLH